MPTALQTAPVTVKLLPSQRLVRFEQRDFCEIAPDEFIAACPVAQVPRIGVVSWKRAEGNLWQPVVQTLPSLVHRGQWKPEVYGCSWYTVVRLALAGFVEFVKPGPRTTAIALDTYFAHLTLTKDDPWFWTAERLAAFDDVKLRAAKAAEEDDETLTAAQAAEKALGPPLPL